MYRDVVQLVNVHGCGTAGECWEQLPVVQLVNGEEEEGRTAWPLPRRWGSRYP